MYSTNKHKNNKSVNFLFYQEIDRLCGLCLTSDVLNIIDINIHSIYTKQAGDGDNCYINTPTAQREDTKQETNKAEKCYRNTDSISKYNNKDKSMVNNQLSNTVNYFIPGPNYDNDKKKSAEITEQLQRDFEDVFNGIGCFDGTFHCS